MELSKNYIPAATEDKWNEHWTRQRYFNSCPDGRPAFTVVIPPPNVTGVLHMGHTLNETVQDILVRKARMSGFNACWVPGSDHASIATEARVVAMLKERGIEKNQLTRPEFMAYAYEWKEKYGGIIYSQIRKLGCSVDWDRESFTMDGDYYDSVIRIFIDLYEKGLIYRGARMINWDPQAKTALSDEEVEYRDEMGKLYYVNYPIADATGKPTGRHIMIATQRPETIMGDTAVCVNPNDERYKDLAGAFAIVPLVNRKVPIIFDDYVDPAFGTGALKVTPAHDINDYNLGLKHSLPIVDTLNPDGTLSAAAEVFVGMDRFAARKKVIESLRDNGLLVKEEDHPTRLGFSQRTNAVVEPRISTQWFVRMAALAEPALTAVTEGYIHIHPGDKFLATYKYWLENVKDWCISRQLWWGQQIPAWYAPDGSFRVAATRGEAYAKFAEPDSSARSDASLPFAAADLRQDEDVLDTWFSSWLWPIEVFKGITNPGNPEIRYYYPTSVLVTGQDIIFFWVARMIMAGLYYFPDSLPMEKRVPFRDVYFTGMVRDKQGRKMSKSLGNSPDLLDLIDKYGADAVRFGILISSPAGNDLLFDEGALEQGRAFNNKIWNALKLVKTVWRVADHENAVPAFVNAGEAPQFTDWIPQPDHSAFASTWFRNRLSETRNELFKLYQGYKLSEALKVLYSLIWDDFCSWYLELIKPEFGQKIDYQSFNEAISFFEELILLLHPFMPFITEEIYHLITARSKGDDITVRQYTFDGNDYVNENIRLRGEVMKSLVTAIRDLKAKLNIKVRDLIHPAVKTERRSLYEENESAIKKMTVSGSLNYVNNPPQNSLGAYFGPYADTAYLSIETSHLSEGNSKADTLLLSQKNKLLEQLEYQRKFLEIILKKLNNQRFLTNASPEVVEFERKKKEDAELKIKNLEDTLSAFK